MVRAKHYRRRAVKPKEPELTEEHELS
jgi:hypothetical protein